MLKQKVKKGPVPFFISDLEDHVAIGWHWPHILVYKHLELVDRGTEAFHGREDGVTEVGGTFLLGCDACCLHDVGFEGLKGLAGRTELVAYMGKKSRVEWLQNCRRQRGCKASLNVLNYLKISSVKHF